MSAAQILGLREHSCLAKKYIMGEINGKKAFNPFWIKKSPFIIPFWIVS